jgi:arylsulfatase A-like enzyme
MAEYMRRFADTFKDKIGYEGYLNWRVAALSEVLQDEGYHTMMSGKWHLGLTKELAPCSRGFDKNFSFLPGSGNHHAYEPQLDPNNKKAHSIPCIRTRDFWMEGDRFIDMFNDLPKDFYSTTSFTDKMLTYLNERSDGEKAKPFFAYLPYTAPHWPLQAPKEIMKKYGTSYALSMPAPTVADNTQRAATMKARTL